ncbi:MAG TPA: DegT/DnrJ/EryC1/StrS family aminotransferase, partial [Bacteroidales bacterium]|nr:DegT/DnrJ/EryC1/StrS family aminotransferase [Bacteroidales bacterium]
VKRDYLKAFDLLNRNGFLTIPKLPNGATENGNMFFAVCRTNEERNQLLKFLTREGIHAVFHYLPLHNSPYFSPLHDGRELPNTIRFSENIIRFPFYSGLETEDIEWIAKTTAKFFAK